MVSTSTAATTRTAARTTGAAAKKKIGKNYTSAIFPETERYSIYHKIESYPSVKRFFDKRSRGSKRTAAIYHTGLTYLEKYLQYRYQFSIERLVEKLRKNNSSKDKIDIYTMIEDLVNFLLIDLHKTPNTTSDVIKAIRSFFRSERISLDPRLVSECASIPKRYRDTESDFALDKATAAKILSASTKRRLRVFLYTLASSGARVGELSAIRWSDLDLNTNPVSIHLRPEITKTKVGRTVYVTKETAEEIRQWLQYRQACRERGYKNGNASSPNIDPNEYVFQVYGNKNNDDGEADPKHIMHDMQVCFSSHLKSLGLHHCVARKANNNGNNNKKEIDGRYDKTNYARSNITLHSFRKLYKTIISLQAKEADLSEYLLGHRSTLNQIYFKISPSDVAKVYLERCEKYLTFNDVAGLETDLLSVSKQNETLAQKLIEERESKDRELSELKKRMAEYEQRFASFKDINNQIDELRNQINSKTYNTTKSTN